MARSHPGAVEDRGQDPEDPVVAIYKVFTTPEVTWNKPPPQAEARRDLYLLQYPTQSRDLPYNESRTPHAMRLKPENGFIEVDVPLQTGSGLGGGRAKAWAQALRETGIGGERGTFGAASGFMNTSLPPGARRGEQADASRDSLQTQTLGGMLSKPRKGKPRYVVGTFRAKELHLTPVSGVAQLRPQLHHIDAVDLLDRQTSRAVAASASEAAGGRSSAVSRMLTISQSTQGGSGGASGESGAGKTRELLSRAAEENWSELPYYNEEDGKSYDAFQQHAFLVDSEKGKVVSSQWTKEQFLDRVGIKPASGRAGHKRPSSRRKLSSHAPAKGPKNTGHGPRPSSVESSDVNSDSSGEESGSG